MNRRIESDGVTKARVLKGAPNKGIDDESRSPHLFSKSLARLPIEQRDSRLTKVPSHPRAAN